MPVLDPSIIALLAGAANIIVQLFKGLLSDKAKEFIPLIVIVLLTVVGVLLAFGYDRDLIAGLLEGFFAGATAVGFYEGVSSIPGVNKVYNGRGWISS